MHNRILTTAALLCLTTSASAAAPAQLDARAVRTVLVQYLAQQGDLCLGKFHWPIEVSASDVAAGTRDALQMPVLETLGLVQASAASAPTTDESAVAPTRYTLSAAGKKFYLQRTMARATPDGKEMVRQGDFCVAKLSLDRVVKWTPVSDVGGHRESTASYTYKIAGAEWSRDPAVRKVFPMVARVFDGAGTMELKQRLRLAGKRWVAVNAWD